MAKQKHTMIEFNVNFLSIDQSTGAPIVVLKEKDGDPKRILLFLIGESEASSIHMRLEKMELPRPMTHDLLKTVIERLDAAVSFVCVTAFEERTFYAQIKLLANGNEFDIDSRPSDAIALALRCDAPIYVAEDVVEEHGFSEKNLEKPRKRDTKDLLENLDDDTLKQYTV